MERLTDQIEDIQRKNPGSVYVVPGNARHLWLGVAAVLVPIISSIMGFWIVFYPTIATKEWSREEMDRSMQMSELKIKYPWNNDKDLILHLIRENTRRYEKIELELKELRQELKKI